MKKEPKQNLKNVFDYIPEENPGKLAHVYRSVKSSPCRIRTKLINYLISSL